MNLVNFYISVTFWVNLFLMLYQFIVVLLLIGTLFKNNIKTESYNLLYVLNTLAAWWCSLYVFLAYGTKLFMAWYGQNAYEWYAFNSNVPDRCWTLISIISILSFLLGLLMFFRKLRIKRWFTLLFFLSNCSFFFERMVIFITSLYRDYLPSSWSAYSEHPYSRYLFSYALIILSLVVIYLWAKKKGRLPFPSVFF